MMLPNKFDYADQQRIAELEAENAALRAALEAAMKEFTICPECKKKKYVLVKNSGCDYKIEYLTEITHAADCIIGIALGLSPEEV